MSRRILVTGSRELTDYLLVRKSIAAHLLLTGEAVVVHGAAPGADSLAAKTVEDLAADMPALWARYGFSLVAEPHHCEP